jgi:hypothetical protein
MILDILTSEKVVKIHSMGFQSENEKGIEWTTDFRNRFRWIEYPLYIVWARSVKLKESQNSVLVSTLQECVWKGGSSLIENLSV